MQGEHLAPEGLGHHGRDQWSDPLSKHANRHRSFSFEARMDGKLKRRVEKERSAIKNSGYELFTSSSLAEGE